MIIGLAKQLMIKKLALQTFISETPDNSHHSGGNRRRYRVV